MKISLRLLAVVSALLAISCGASAQLKKRAAYDMQCPEAELELTEIDSITSGVRGCGQQATYVQACPTGQACTWVLNSDSRPAPTATSSTSSSPSNAPSPVASEESDLAPSADFPEDAVGYIFSMSLDEAESACRDAGHAWKETAKGAKCAGTPKDIGIETQSSLRFCGEKLCNLGLVMSMTEENQSAALNIWKTLHSKYGSPSERKTGVPRSCSGQLYSCLKSGQAVMDALWRWDDDSKITAKFITQKEKLFFTVHFRKQMESAPNQLSSPPADVSEDF